MPHIVLLVAKYGVPHRSRGDRVFGIRERERRSVVERVQRRDHVMTVTVEEKRVVCVKRNRDGLSVSRHAVRFDPRRIVQFDTDVIAAYYAAVEQCV